MSKVYILYTGDIPSTREYELVRKNTHSVTVRVRSGEQTLRESTSYETIFDEAGLKNRIQSVLSARKKMHLSAIARIEEAQRDGIEIVKIPHDKSFFYDKGLGV